MTGPTPWRLAVLTRTAQMAKEIDATLARMVAGARADGFSWQEIGDALGITRQGARQRFGTREGGSDEPAQ